MKLLFSFTCLLLISTSKSFSQNIDSTIEKYANDYSEPKIYLHYDKSSYAPGETIWYAAYLLNGITPADDCRTLYVDWTDDKGKLLEHNIIPVVYATAAGQYDIPAQYSGRFLHVRVYTRWMLNFDSSFLYNKDIRVISQNSQNATKSSIIPSIQFFPEGGDAVMGVLNKIAFKANDQWGRPVKVKGVVVDNKGTNMDSLHLIHDGMGYFFILPKPGETFKAKWTDEKGTSHTTALPGIEQKGIALQITLAGDKRNFSVSATPGAATEFGMIHMLGTMNQHEVFKFSKDITLGDIKGVIPTSELPSGILTITVFDSDWQPLAERITYVNNGDYTFNAEMSVQHWGLNKRARNEVQITVPDSLPASFSVAVTDADIDTDSSDNIISHLMLTGDLKGQVYNPAWYFANNSDSLAQQLDLVMLTHGWRRFNWTNVIAGKFPKIVYPKDSTYMTLSGIIYGALPSQIRGAGNIILLLKPAKQKNQVVSVPINSDGTFADPQTVLFDSTRIYYQFPKGSGLSDASVRFMQNRLSAFPFNMPATGRYFDQVADTAGNYRHAMLADSIQKLLSFYKGKVLPTVTIQPKTKTVLEKMDEEYTSGVFSGGDGYQFNVLNDPSVLGLPNILTYLQGKVPGLQINSTGTNPTILWRGSSPLLYLDETPVDINTLTSISVANIAYVKVMRPPFMGSVNGGDGAILIYTKRGSDESGGSGGGLANNIVNGYTSMRQFYAPNYSMITEDNDKRDIRTTLYWNPRIITTKENNNATFTFYNNDVTNSFRVVIEGMSNDGRLVHIENLME
jgi:hypothetical protein